MLSSTSQSNSTHYEAVRTATSVLCEVMLRQPMDPNVRESEEIRVRMRALGRLELVWRENEVSMKGNPTPLASGASGNGIDAGAGIVGEEKVQRLFSKALRDGYVLCQLLNKFRPGSIPHVDANEDGVLHMSNVTNFLASCSANGLLQEELFLPFDLIEGTPHSITRVATTVIALAKWAGVSTPTYSQPLPGGSNTNPEKPSAFRLSRLLPKRSLVTTGTPLVLPFFGSAHVATREPPPPRPPRSSRRPAPPKRPPDTASTGNSLSKSSVNGAQAITHSTRDPSISLSMRNQFVSSSTTNQSTRESFPTMPWTKILSPSKEIYPPVMNQSTANDSLTNQSRQESRVSLRSHRTTNQPNPSPGSVPSHRTTNQFNVSPGSMLSRWTNNQSRVSPRSTHSHQTNNQYTVSPASILSHQTNNQYSVSPASILSRQTNNQSIVSPGSITPHSANDQSRAPSPRSMPSRSTRTRFIASSPKGVPPSTEETFPSTKNILIPPPFIRQSIDSPRTEEPSTLRMKDTAQSPVDGLVPESPHSPRTMWWNRVRRVLARLPGRARRQGIPEPGHSQANPDHLNTRGHTFVDVIFSKSLSCRVCVKPMKKGAVLCSRCSLIAHSKCAARAQAGCDP